MAFTLQQQILENGPQVLQYQGPFGGPPLDSITLGQLRQMVNAPQKQKVGLHPALAAAAHTHTTTPDSKRITTLITRMRILFSKRLTSFTPSSRQINLRRM